jgi:hypothetical protein
MLLAPVWLRLCNASGHSESAIYDNIKLERCAIITMQNTGREKWDRNNRRLMM